MKRLTFILLFLVCLLINSYYVLGQVNNFRISNYKDGDSIVLNTNYDYISLNGTYSQNLKHSKVFLYQASSNNLEEIREVILMPDSTWSVEFFPNEIDRFKDRFNNLKIYFIEKKTKTILNNDSLDHTPLTSINLKLNAFNCNKLALSGTIFKITNIKNNQKISTNLNKYEFITINGTYKSNELIKEDIYLVESIFIKEQDSYNTILLLKQQIKLLNDSTWTVEYIPTKIGEGYSPYTLYLMSGIDCNTTLGGSSGSNYNDIRRIFSWASVLASVNIRVKVNFEDDMRIYTSDPQNP